MKHKKLVTAIARMVGITVLGTQMVQAGGVIVNSTSDQPQQGLTTLREAIEDANQTSGAVIDFDPEVFSEPQTITLERGEILISSSVSINGPGSALLTIDGNSESRVLRIDDGDDTTAQVVDLSGVTLTNGNGNSPVISQRGGCIIAFEQLTITDSKVTGCSTADGGGVWSRFGSLVITGSEITNNFASRRGGGVYARDEPVFITNTTISGNTANRNGEAGGGINTNNADLEMTNSTISNNQVRDDNAGGIFMINGGALSLVNSTVFNNAGVGIDPSGPVNISNSLIAGHVSGDCNFTEINTNSNNQNNMDSDGSCDVFASNHLTVADPLLGPLADNGGLTMTHRPLAGSPVIDSGDGFFCESADQRGENRPQDGDSDGTSACDIGAVEFIFSLDELLFNDGFDVFNCGGLTDADNEIDRGCQ